MFWEDSLRASLLADVSGLDGHEGRHTLFQYASMDQKCGAKGSETVEHFHVVFQWFPTRPFGGCCSSWIILVLEGTNLFSWNIKRGFITQLPYTFSDGTNQPPLIENSISSNGTSGWNVNDNWTRLWLLKLLTGHYIPEKDETWDVWVIVKRFFTSVTVESVCFLDCPLFTKLYFIFHSTLHFFQKANNFKTIALTLALRHHKMTAFHWDTITFFKPSVKTFWKSNLLWLHRLLKMCVNV